MPSSITNPCLLCGALVDATVEHIIPQTLWKRFGIDPDRADLATFRTTLCERHNRATSGLHRRPEMLELIDSGRPVGRKTLSQLGEWAVWVTLLLSLARDSGVLGAENARTALLNRFDGTGGGLPRGVRVYAARVGNYVEQSEPATTYALALHDDSRVLLDFRGVPVGFSVGVGTVHASEAIGLGRIVLLVVGRTYTSGVDHMDRLDDVVARLGLARIHPLGGELPSLEPARICFADVHSAFTAVPLGADLSLMPAEIRALGAAWGDE